MVKINVDGKSYEVKEGKNLLETCLSLGFDLPYFCWHPAMHSVGACRQCAIKKFKDENDKHGKIVMACMEPVEDNAIISIKDNDAEEMRTNVIQWLMTNHPHDCPVCDEGGECHLQDMTVMTGHVYRKFRFKKRTYRNQYLGPFINHEMNRCIQCYRCVRFYRDYADGRDFDVFAAHNHVYFGRSEDGVLENEFSGNLVEVCPTGVFTDKTLKKHYTRKWDFTNAPSICTNCGLGCNIIAAERYGSLRRIRSRFNSEVNGYFICDRGRFGYEFVNSDKRIKQPHKKINNELKPISSEEVLEEIKNIFLENKKVIGIGSPRASLQSNFALRKLVGEDNFYNGINGKESKLISLIINVLKNGPARSPSLKDVRESDAVLILGEDLTNTAPMLALAVRQSVKNKGKKIAEKLKIPLWNDAAVRDAAQDEKCPLFVLSPFQTKLDDISEKTFYAPAQNIARFGFAIANLLNNDSPKVENISEEENELIKTIAEKLSEAENPVIISGTSLKDESIIQAAANIAWALCKKDKKAGLSFTVPESNSMGAVMISENNLSNAFEKVDSDEIDVVFILKNDLYRRDTNAQIDKFLGKFKKVIVLDSLLNPTTKKSDLLIPVGAFSESDGTIVNNEGRAQVYYQAYLPEGEIKESWRWLNEISIASGRDEIDFKTFADFTIAVEKAFPVFEGISNITPPPGFRIAGEKIPRAPHRFSGRTAMDANINVSEPKPPEDPDSALSFTMEGYRGKPPSSIIPFFWSPAWNSVQSINKYQIEVGGPLHGGDPGKRLIEPNQSSEINFFSEVPDKFISKEDQLLFVQHHYIYGSEELSSLSPAVAERIPQPYVSINEEAANELSIKEDDKINISIGNEELTLPIKIEKSLLNGIALLPAGLNSLPFLDLPSWGRIKKEKS